MQVALLIFFIGSALCAIGVVLNSRQSISTKVAILVAIVVFAIVTYAFAKSSSISPFARSHGVSFGAQNQSLISIGIALVGAIAGVFGSYIFQLGKADFNLRSLWRPLSACPLVIVPTVKLLESASGVRLKLE
jgi:hypothetical protein